MDALFRLPSRCITQKTQTKGVFPLNLEISGHFLALAADIGDLEECLALERATEGSLPAGEPTQIRSPQAVPYCEFLMVRDGVGRLLAVGRIFCIDTSSPIRRPGNGSLAQPSSLLTALRYSRLGILELGAPALLPGEDAALVADLIGQGLIVYLERKGLALVAEWDAEMESESLFVPFPEGTHASISGINPPSSRERGEEARSDRNRYDISFRPPN